ncbi:MAG: mannose-1-phosphate guanylyltransferase, partial [Salinispira sp.]
IVLPSDHIITQMKAYCETLTCAIDIARSGRIVTFGITPTRPETGYGYIEADTAVSSPQNSYAVRSFREKPNEATAAEYLRAGNYYWNSGMFCFKAGVLLEELSRYAPEVHDACARAVQADTAGTAFAPAPSASPNRQPASQSGGQSGSQSNSQPGRQFWQPQTELMEAIPSVSIDYAVMEHSNRITVLPCSFGWSDLGSLDSLYEYYHSPESGNEDALTRTSGDNLFVSAPQASTPQISAPQPPNTSHTAAPIHSDAQRNMVTTQQHPKKQIALIDVDDLIVVETEDALLISRRGSGQKVKQVVENIELI